MVRWCGRQKNASALARSAYLLPHFYSQTWDIHDILPTYLYESPKENKVGVVTPQERKGAYILTIRDQTKLCIGHNRGLVIGQEVLSTFETLFWPRCACAWGKYTGYLRFCKKKTHKTQDKNASGYFQKITKYLLTLLY